MILTILVACSQKSYMKEYPPPMPSLLAAFIYIHQEVSVQPAVQDKTRKHSLYLRLHRLHILQCLRLPALLLQVVFALLLPLERGGALELRGLVVIERPSLAIAAVLGGCGLEEMRFVWL